MSQRTVVLNEKLVLSHAVKTERIQDHLNKTKLLGNRSDQWLREQWLKELGVFKETQELLQLRLKGIST